MVGVIIGSKKVGVNPDNIATPLAASFGDIITLGLLAIISQGFFYCMGENERPVNWTKTSFTLPHERCGLPLTPFYFVTFSVCRTLPLYYLPGMYCFPVPDAGMGHYFTSSP